MFFTLDNDSLLSHDHQLIIHKSFSCSNANFVIGHIEISVMGEKLNIKARRNFTAVYNRKHVNKLLPTLVQLNFSVSEFRRPSVSKLTLTWRLDTK